MTRLGQELSRSIEEFHAVPAVVSKAHVDQGVNVLPSRSFETVLMMDLFALIRNA